MIEIKKVREAENEQRNAPARYKRQRLGKDKRAHVEETQKIQGNLLMGYFGLCAQESLEKTFQQNMDIGKMFIADFADGEIKTYRKTS